MVRLPQEVEPPGFQTVQTAPQGSRAAGVAAVEGAKSHDRPDFLRGSALPRKTMKA